MPSYQRFRRWEIAGIGALVAATGALVVHLLRTNVVYESSPERAIARTPLTTGHPGYLPMAGLSFPPLHITVTSEPPPSAEPTPASAPDDGEPLASLAMADQAAESGHGRVASNRIRSLGAIQRPAPTPRPPQVTKPPAPNDDEVAAGDIDARRLDAELRAHRRQLRACLVMDETRRFQRAPSAKIDVSWLIQPDGSTSHVAVDTGATDATDVDTAAVSCIQHTVEAWRFTPPQGGAAPASLSVAMS